MDSPPRISPQTSLFPQCPFIPTIVSPRQAILVGLLALVPVASYVLIGMDPLGLIAGVNVVIVTVALFIAFQTIEEDRHDTISQSA